MTTAAKDLYASFFRQITDTMDVATISSTTDRATTIAEIRDWRLQSVNSYLKSTTISGSAPSPPSESDDQRGMKKWTTNDQIKWFRMCKLLKAIASSHYDILQPSDPPILIDEETYWMEGYCPHGGSGSSDKDGINDESDFFYVADKHGFYRLKVPVVTDPNDILRKMICLYTLKKRTPNDYRSIRDSEESSTQFIRFLNLFGVIVGRLFPGVFIVSCNVERFVKTNNDFRVSADTEIRKIVLDETRGKKVHASKGWKLKEIYRQIQSIEDHCTKAVVPSLVELCIAKLAKSTIWDRK